MFTASAAKSAGAPAARRSVFFLGGVGMNVTAVRFALATRSIRRQLRTASLLLFWGIGLGASLQAQELAKFDVPAVVEGRELLSPFGDEAPANERSERLLQITLPVSIWLEPQSREAFYAVEFRVAWAKSIYPLVDYWPKSSSQSSIEGVVLTERQSERRMSGGFATDGLLQTFATAANASASLDEHVSRRYAEVPEQLPLIESGPAERSTGAFFRFHDSRQAVVEGGRELRLLYRLPRSWRAGLLVVEARAYLRRGLGEEPHVAVHRRFLVPVHLNDDESARQLAIAYVQAENQLRGIWTQAGARGAESRPLGAWLRRSPDGSELEQLLVESSGEKLRSASEKFDRQVRSATELLLNRRAELLGMSR